MTAGLIPEQPDAEAWVWANLRHLPGLTSFSYAASLPEGVWQLDPAWMYAYSIQVDARAKTKAAARDHAEAARRIMAGLPAVPWAEGTVTSVAVLEGPFWLPDDDGAPRYCGRYEVRVHPRRAATASPVLAEPAAGTVGRNDR